MENISAKADFLKNKYTALLAGINPSAKGSFGKLGVQQMIEHMSYSFRQANGKDHYECVTPAEHVPRMQDFLKSEKPFKENTPNKLLPDDPEPVKKGTVKESIDELQDEIDLFFSYFENDPGKKVMNPFFGELDYEMWVQLLHKHAWHHLKQFGLEA